MPSGNEFGHRKLDIPLHQLVKKLRKRTGHSIRSFAEELGMPATTYQYYESRAFHGLEVKPEVRNRIVPALLRLGASEQEVEPLGRAPAQQTRDIKLSAKQIEALHKLAILFRNDQRKIDLALERFVRSLELTQDALQDEPAEKE